MQLKLSTEEVDYTTGLQDEEDYRFIITQKSVLQVLEYEYEPEMEDTYRSSMLKTFKKTLDDGFFPFIILDTINDRVKHFDQFWSAAKTKGFEVSCVH